MSVDHYFVCETCKVKAVKHHKYVLGNGRSTHWKCPICFEQAFNRISKYSCRLTEDELDSNLKFLAFMHGIDFDNIPVEIWE